MLQRFWHISGAGRGARGYRCRAGSARGHAQLPSTSVPFPGLG